MSARLEAPREYARRNVVGIRFSTRALEKLSKYAREIGAAKSGTSQRVPYESEQDRVARNVEMFVGEMALAVYYGVPYTPSILRLSGDAGWDVIAPDGVKVNVKCSSRKNPRLLVRAEEVHDAELYVLARWVPEERVVWFLGEADREYVLEYGGPPRRVRDDGPLNYILTMRELDPVRRRRSEPGRRYPGRGE